jgi:hypothetical protein
VNASSDAALETQLTEIVPWVRPGLPYGPRDLPFLRNAQDPATQQALVNNKSNRSTAVKPAANAQR